MRALLIYPSYPETFWSFKYSLPFVRRKAAYPPLGLLTVASLLPSHWELKLVDLNVRTLSNEDILWADVVCMSAMDIQVASAKEVIARCRELGRKIVAGGPLFTSRWDEFSEVDHLVIGEGEGVVEEFARDFEKGRARRVYKQQKWVSLETTPIPSWDLIDPRDYAALGLQFSRGCPYDCEFCDVTVLFGRQVRTKTSGQVTEELDAIYKTGWRGGVFFVDDNFIGDRKKVKEEILPAVIRWNEEKKNPFDYITQVSINVVDDDELLSLLSHAGFDELFIGIETPENESLRATRKIVNLDRDLVENVRKLQKKGFLVHGGFIVGFDTDRPGIFDRLIDFIEISAIPVAMVGLLNAPRGTRLYERLFQEGRILKDSSGDNTDFSLNFVPSMDLRTLIEGYRRIVSSLYIPERYVKRTISCLKNLSPDFSRKSPLTWRDAWALIRSIFQMGFGKRWRKHYWKLISWSAARKPKLIPLSVKLLIYGYHFEKVFLGKRKATAFSHQKTST